MGSHTPGHTQTHQPWPKVCGCPASPHSGLRSVSTWLMVHLVHGHTLRPTWGPSQAHEWRLRRAGAVPSTLGSCWFSPLGKQDRVPALQKRAHQAVSDFHTPSPPAVLPGRCIGSFCRECPPGHSPLAPHGPWPAPWTRAILGEPGTAVGKQTLMPVPGLPGLHMAWTSSPSGTPAKAVLGQGLGFSPRTGDRAPRWDSVHCRQGVCLASGSPRTFPERIAVAAFLCCLHGRSGDGGGGEGGGYRLQDNCAPAYRAPPSSESLGP